MSTALLAFHRTAGHDREGRVRLLIERHGSLPVEQVVRVVRPLGFSLVLAPGADARSPQRHYPDRSRDQGDDVLSESSTSASPQERASAVR